MKRLTKRECIGVAGVALVAIAVTWFALVAGRSHEEPVMPENVVLFSADSIDNAKQDSIKLHKREKGKKGNKKTKKSTAKKVKKSVPTRSFRDETL